MLGKRKCDWCWSKKVEKSHKKKRGMSRDRTHLLLERPATIGFLIQQVSKPRNLLLLPHNHPRVNRRRCAILLLVVGILIVGGGIGSCPGGVAVGFGAVVLRAPGSECVADIVQLGAGVVQLAPCPCEFALHVLELVG